MSNTTAASPTHKSAYKRPYASRKQRREVDRRKYNQTNDYRFLIWMGVGMAVLVVLVLCFVLKGTPDRVEEPVASTTTLRYRPLPELRPGPDSYSSIMPPSRPLSTPPLSF